MIFVFRKLLVVIALIPLLQTSLIADVKDEAALWKEIKMADDYLVSDQFEKALELYNKIYAEYTSINRFPESYSADPEGLPIDLKIRSEFIKDKEITDYLVDRIDITKNVLEAPGRGFGFIYQTDTDIKISEINLMVNRNDYPISKKEITKSIEQSSSMLFNNATLAKIKEELLQKGKYKLLCLRGRECRNSEGEKEVILDVFLEPDISKKELNEYRKKIRENLYPDKFPEDAAAHGYYGYRSNLGDNEWVGGEPYEVARPFDGEYAIVKEINGLWGVIDRRIGFVIEPQYFTESSLKRIMPEKISEHENKEKLDEVKRALGYDKKSDQKNLLELVEKKYKPAFALYGTILANNNDKNAVKWLEEAAENDDPNAIYKIGELYEQGKIVDKNVSKAISFYEKAANLKNAPAIVSLIEYYYGKNKEKKNLEMVLKYTVLANQIGGPTIFPFKAEDDIQWLKKRAAKNDSGSQYVLATIYENGLHNDDLSVRLKPDFDEALKLYEKAARNGFKQAIIKYGELKLRQSSTNPQ